MLVIIGVARPYVQTIVRDDDGVACLFIADESPGQSLKNPGSLRRVMSFADTLGI